MLTAGPQRRQSTYAVVASWRDPECEFRVGGFAWVGKLSQILTANPSGFRSVLGIDFTPEIRLQPRTADTLWNFLQIGRMPAQPTVAPIATAHSDAVVAVDARGNVAAVMHTINTVSWGATGIFVGGISIPDSASFQQQQIAKLAPGSRLPDSGLLGIALKQGRPALGFSAVGSGLHMRTFTALVSVLGRGLTPGQAIDEPSLGGFDFLRANPEGIPGVVGQQQFDSAYLKALRDLGQNVIEDNSMRGYWIGVSIDPNTRKLHGAPARELPGQGGAAVGF